MTNQTENYRLSRMQYRKPVWLPGDAIGFSGVDLASDVINLATWGWPRRGISHVGIVTDDPRHGICLAESTTLAFRPCLIRGERVNGVQLQPLQERIDEYGGRVWHYPLRVPLQWPESESLNKYLLDLAGSKCAYDLIGAVRSRTTPYAIVQRWKHGCEDLHTLFCSELLAAAWNRVGVFETKNASGWSPNAILREAVRKDIVLPPFQVK